ncbi:hypothetical protein G7Y89_g5140 [Cudoniella acicularis]|uniref:Uncharacterized protein n=1 Tax=Cudoniella acicularis TaxID=354080 RepID=A0A8H4RN27_9HELO|nr:hypothetical protein G7Y89_g5140 [Cudoniella acicularis]
MPILANGESLLAKNQIGERRGPGDIYSQASDLRNAKTRESMRKSKISEETSMTLLKLIEPGLFQGGYLNFASSSYIAMDSYETAGPKRTSMLDDILYYWKHAPNDSFPTTNPLKSAIYAKKIAAANWMNALEYIQRSVGAFENRVDQLETKEPLDEAEATKTLQQLGTVYLPLSLVASILSMGNQFSPGQSLFWVYFVIAFPLMAIIYVLILRWETIYGYVTEAVKWVKGKNRAHTSLQVTEGEDVSGLIPGEKDIEAC